MINNSFENFINQDFNLLAKWLSKVNSYEFALYGIVAAFLIAPTLNANEQNSLGNWLEEIGQILLTISSQTFNLNDSNYNAAELENILSLISKLKKD